MRWCLFAGLSIGLLATTHAAEFEEPTPEEMLQGGWSLASAEADGLPLTKSQIEGSTLVIKKDQYTTTLHAIGTIKGRMKLGDSGKFNTIDFRDANGPRSGKMSRGIFKVTEEEFRVIAAPPGRPRPTQFKTVPGSGQWMQVWTRQK